MGNALKAIADFLEREAGHTAVAFLLLFVGGLFWKLGAPKSEDVIVFSLGLLGRGLGIAAASALRSVAGAKP